MVSDLRWGGQLSTVIEQCCEEPYEKGHHSLHHQIIGKWQECVFFLWPSILQHSLCGLKNTK